LDDHLEQLALLLLAAVLASTLSLGTVMALSQRNGFNDFLRVRKEQELDRFIGVVERHAAQDPSLQWLDRAPEAMHQLVGEHELHRLARWGVCALRGQPAGCALHRGRQRPRCGS
jgi:hypothetical protein